MAACYHFLAYARGPGTTRKLYFQKTYEHVASLLTPGTNMLKRCVASAPHTHVVN